MTPPQLDIHANSGPIMVAVEYRVPGRNANEFIAVINELGRIRQRDGARDWSAAQDLDQPDVWVERFQSPNWLEHQRRVTRHTQADQRIRDKLAKLVTGGGGGDVRRFIGRPAGSEPIGLASRSDAEPPTLPLQ